VLPIAVDAMGGDRAPGEIVAGARKAAETLGVPILLVGRSADLGDTGGLDVFEASEVVEMGEEPAGAVRRKKDSSLVRCAELVRDGKASAMVSAGNTGATMGSALLRMGRIKGVNRPAVATPIPVPGSTPTTLLDAGANSDCQAEWLLQFAKMGAAYATARFEIESPKVGLLSIGEEAGKGNALVKETRELLLASDLNFIGNVEGRDIMTPDVDVVVTDGFTGNVVLKTLEGCMRGIVKALLETFGATPERQVAMDVLMPGFLELYNELNPDTTGGALLLGANGVCIISHGSSNSDAIVNAIAVASEMVERDLVGALRRAVAAV
jgi:glycerol-3-phosphate acyltransferase PlsX